MKKLLLLLAVVLIYSCSSNSDIEPASDYFKYTYDGKEVTIKKWAAKKSEKTFEVIGSAEDEQSFGIIFNEYGNLQQAVSYSTNFSFPSSWSYAYYKANYFKIESIKVNKSTQRVTVQFSGNLYEDEHNLDSNKHTVKGEFSVKYEEVVPLISGLETSAKINGKQWYATDSDSEGGFFSGSDIQLNQFGDDEYQISFVLNHDNTKETTYKFDSNATVNNIRFFKFDMNGEDEIEYETEGVLTITEKKVGTNYTLLTATYSFLANNGSEIITVSEGKIKTLYTNY